MKEFIAEEKIKEIRERASILEVVSDFVSLKKSGKNYLGLCPFHAERTPSFTVNEEKGIFHCFGCGAGGNVFNFLMRLNNLSFPEAVKTLAQRYGISLPIRELSAAEKLRRSLQENLFAINELVCKFYHRLLTSEKEGEEGRNYLAKRGISSEIIQLYRLGFAPATWDSLVSFLKEQGIALNYAQSLGLIIPRQEGKDAGEETGYYDRFRSRIIFPIFTVGGKVCGFGGRIIFNSSSEADQQVPKYINSPESPIYRKGHVLYGLNIAQKAIREKGRALIVEGYMDLLSLFQEGFRNVVASLGTALTSAQVNLLSRYTAEAILIFDADEGGQKATQRSLELFLQAGISVRIASLPPGFDPDSFIRQEKRRGLEEVIHKALPLMEYLLGEAIRRHGIATIEGKVRVLRELIPAWQQLKDPLEQNLYVELIANKLGLKESQIRSQLKARTKVEAIVAESLPISSGPAHEKVLLQLMLSKSSLLPEIERLLREERFENPRFQKLAQDILHFWKNQKKFEIHEFLNQLEDDDVRDLVSELLLTEESITEPERMLYDCWRRFCLHRLQKEIKRVDEEIRHRIQEGKRMTADVSGMKELFLRKQRLLQEQKKWVKDSIDQFITQAS